MGESDFRRIPYGRIFDSSPRRSTPPGHPLKIGARFDTVRDLLGDYLDVAILLIPYGEGDGHLCRRADGWIVTACHGHGTATHGDTGYISLLIHNNLLFVETIF